MNNYKNCTIKITRIELCDLLLACWAAEEKSGAEKWAKLHDKLRAQLDAIDEKLDSK